MQSIRKHSKALFKFPAITHVNFSRKESTPLNIFRCNSSNKGNHFHRVAQHNYRHVERCSVLD